MNSKCMFLISMLLLINGASADTCQLARGGDDLDTVLDSAMLQVSMFAAGWLMFYGVKHRWLPQPPSMKTIRSGPNLLLSPGIELDDEHFDDQSLPHHGGCIARAGGQKDQARGGLSTEALGDHETRPRCALEAELAEADMGFPSPSRLSSPSTTSGDSSYGAISSQASMNADVAIVTGLARLLESKKGPEPDAKLPPWRRTCFHARTSPSEDDTTDVDLDDYLSKLHWYFECSGTAFVVALVYIERVLRSCPDLRFSDKTSERLVLASLVVALKYHDDEYPYKNSWYAETGNVSVQVLNEMEAQLCKMLEWKLFVGPEEYEQCYELIMRA